MWAFRKESMSVEDMYLCFRSLWWVDYLLATRFQFILKSNGGTIILFIICRHVFLKASRASAFFWSELIRGSGVFTRKKSTQKDHIALSNQVDLFMQETSTYTFPICHPSRHLEWPSEERLTAAALRVLRYIFQFHHTEVNENSSSISS